MEESVALDVNGEVVRVPRAGVVRLRDLAAADAGRSTARRDLSLLLDRALAEPRVLALRRAEARTLAELLAEQDVGPELGELRAVAERERAP